MVDDTDQTILSLLRGGPSSSSQIASVVGLSRQAVHRRLQKLIESGAIRCDGAARATRYHLIEQVWDRRFRRAGLDEAAVFDELGAGVPALESATNEAIDLTSYVVTELVNNAIDHSSADAVRVVARGARSALTIAIIDDGVGAFAHVRDTLGLADDLAALQEISKGKTTTDPDRHTGEGLFFVSKAAETFRLESGELAWLVDNHLDDWTVATLGEPRRGTLAQVQLDLGDPRDLKAIFDRYTDDYEFSKTRIVVELFAIGVRFISRSEAKRLLRNLERFSEIVLDFRGVDTVGQGFADQVFRVWASSHPEIRLDPINMSPAVEFMVRRSIR